jgi:ribosomal 50S subunit-associated protein YjgA (DUF615 family)
MVEKERTYELLKNIANKLDILAGLLCDLKEMIGNKSSVKEKVAYFANKHRDMSNPEISRALGISEKHVSKEKALLKRTENGRKEIIREDGQDDQALGGDSGAG